MCAQLLQSVKAWCNVAQETASELAAYVEMLPRSRSAIV